METSDYTDNIQTDFMSYYKNQLKLETKQNLSNSRDYYTNLIHHYPAKMFRQIPQIFLKIYGERGGLVLDPFCGSGTVLMQAGLYGMNTIGIDVNPLSVMISRVKSSRFNINKLQEQKKHLFNKIKNSSVEIEVPNFPNRDFWFEKKVQEDLTKISYFIKKIKNKKYREFFLVCLSEIIRKVSNADPRICPPVKSKHMHKLIKGGRKIETYKIFQNTVNINIKRVSKFSKDSTPSKRNAVIGDARNIKLCNESVDLVMTSPPYISAQKYVRSLSLEMYWLDLVNDKKIKKIDYNTIGTERTYIKDRENINETGNKLADFHIERIKEIDKERAAITYKYFRDMRKSIGEIYRVLKRGGYFILLIGNNNVRGKEVESNIILSQMAKENDFKIERVFLDKIKYRGFMTKRNKTADIIDSEWIFVLRK